MIQLGSRVKELRLHGVVRVRTVPAYAERGCKGAIAEFLKRLVH